MKKIIYALLATLSGLVLLFSYRTSLDAVPPDATAAPASSSTTSGEPAASGSGASGSGTAASSGGSSGSSTSSTDAGSSSSSGLRDGTYTGVSANTRYGPVQVQITVSSGQIAEVQVVDYPDSNGRDQAINQRAIPALVSETTQAQSARIDMVSGATYTSRGYLASLQSAIDQASS